MTARKVTAKKSTNTKAPPKRTDAAGKESEKPVTTLAHVDANTTDAEAKEISGFHGDGSSQQQKDAYEGVKHDREHAAHPDKADPEPHPHVHGPGGMIS